MSNMSQSIAQKIKNDAEAEAAKKQAEAGGRIIIAEAFDAYNSTLPQIEVPRVLPWHVFAQSYKHCPAVGRLAFRDVDFAELAQMLQDYPPVKQIYYRSTQRRESGFRCDGFVPDYADQRTETQGVNISVSGGIGYLQQVKAEWVSILNGVFVEFGADIKAGYKYQPRMQGGINEWCGQAVSIDANRVQFVIPFGKKEGVRWFRYSQGSKTAYPEHVMYGDVIAYVQSIADDMRETRAAGFAAYLADKRDGLAPDDTERNCTGFSAGSSAQNDCLETHAARVDRALARKHWKAYVQDATLDSWGSKDAPRADYFDHYAWARRWLNLQGLLYDPALMHKGKPYRYGTAWVNADQSIHGG